MTPTIDGIIDRQLRRWELERSIARATGATHSLEPASQPLITVSRQHGSRGAEIAAGLAEHFQYTLLHRDVIDRLCESTGYSHRLLEALDERTRSGIDTWCASMVSGHYVDSSDYVRALFQTIQSIARLGGVVVVGRGSNFIVGLDHGFHVRVVAPRESRIQRLMDREGVGRREAEREVSACDRVRSEFTRRTFGRSADDPLAYDVVVNSDSMPPDAACDWLAEAARLKFHGSSLLAERAT